VTVLPEALAQFCRNRRLRSRCSFAKAFRRVRLGPVLPVNRFIPPVALFVSYSPAMRLVVIISLAVVVLSLYGGHRHFTPRPSAPLPAANVP
jgi:hypothetical protein